MKLNNTIATPLYKTVKKYEKKLTPGAGRPAVSMPTENELSESYHVSRAYRAKALAVLYKCGY